MVLADGSATPVDVNANQTDPNTFTAGGVTEFELSDPAIALNGSWTADAPFLLIYLDTTGVDNASVSYKLRDLDGSTDDALQQVALQYRVGDTGDFINIAAGYVADASEPGTATKVTPVSVGLPTEAMNQSLVQLRILTTNASGSDEWIGIDDLEITSSSSPATFDLQITEIWSGNGGSPNVTADWFEIINHGSAPWVAGVDPDLFYDDESADPTTADMVQGLGQLAPGQRAIVVIGDSTDADTFRAVWQDDADLTDLQVGFTDGAGLGASGDGVNLWVGNPQAGGILVDSEAYPNAEANGGQSYDLELGEFSLVGNGSDAVATTETGGSTGTEPAIASPGNQGAATQIVRIHDIQGAGHTSPLVGQAVADVPGIVTAVDSNGFYFQDPNPDDNLATSEAIFVFTGSAPTVQGGDAVTVSGTVSEFTPGGASTGNLSTTQIISGNSSVSILSSNNPLPAAIVLGSGGRELPDQVIDSDALNIFNPTTDGIDFYESLEGMRVTAKDVVTVSSTNRFGEIYGVVDNGANATGISQRGTINIAPDDFNPERVQIDEDTGIFDFDFPNVTVGASLGDVTGVIGYNFGNFEIIPTEDFVNQIQPSTLQPKVSTLSAGNDQLLLATYNVLNLDPNDADGDTDIADGRFTAIAEQIVNNLNTPDIIGLQEIQDNSGSTNDGVVSADVTLQTLITAIATAGGPTYEFVDNTFISNNTSGGQPGANIRTAFLYNPDRVELVADSVQTVGSQGNGEAFFETRLPLIADFTFNGETVTVVNNHFSSKGGSSPLFGVNQPSVGDEANGNGQEDVAINGSLDQRRAQAQVVNDFVDAVLANNADANLVVLGDLNEFEFISPLEILAGDVLANLVETLPDTERYSFIFDGNSQSLDHILVTENLSTSAQVDIVHLNTEFVDNAQRASDHDPILAQINFSNPMPTTFTLQLFHTSDQEAGVPALDDAPRFSAVLNALLNEDLDNDGNAGFDNTLILSSGDAYIPGIFLSASEEVFGGIGRGDILIQNALGFQAIAFGNHEFDLNTGLVADLIGGNAEDNFPGTNFPYLSSNLDFSTDANLAGLVVADDQAPQPNSIAATTVIDVNGEKIGVVGATTPTIVNISSPGGITVNPQPFDGAPTPEQLDALAAEIQADVDQLLAANPDINKVVLLAHMQQIAIEQELATRLTNVDIIVAGGSNTRLVDETDRLRTGDTAQGVYPIIKTAADGNPVAVVNTDGNYKYVGRLVVDFDENGVLIPESYDPVISGAYATDDQGVTDLNAAGLIDPEIQGIVDQLRAVILATESNVFGVSDEYLAGLRGDVRVQETNLGNLTADANLAIAKETDPDVVISLKNGGGIRNDIGQVLVPTGGTGDPLRLPNEAVTDAEGNVIKPEGGISETDIANALSFNNGLSLVTVTATELLALMEHGFAASSLDDSNTQGRFPQIGGFSVSVDLTRDPGDRILSLAIEDETGKDLDVVVKDGDIVGDPNRTVRMVTLGFLAGGGDGYPFPTGDSANRVDLNLADEAPRTGVATFAPDGSEQDSLAEYLAVNFSTPETGFNQADTPRELDTRIQNLAFREDTVIDPMEQSPVGELVFGSPDADLLIAGSDFAGVNDTLFTGAGDDEVDILFGGAAAGNNRINTGSGADLIFVGNGDRLNAGSGDDEIDATDAMGYRLDDNP